MVGHLTWFMAVRLEKGLILVFPKLYLEVLKFRAGQGENPGAVVPASCLECRRAVTIRLLLQSILPVSGLGNRSLLLKLLELPNP